MAVLSSVLRDIAAERLPRYTSYPTAPHFTPAIDAAIARKWIAATDPAATVSLYLHVPYCRSLCWYCGCHTKIPADDAAITRYVETLISEIDMVTSPLSKPLRVTHLHWGGGTPTIIGPSALHRVLATIERDFYVDNAAELAIEIDPRMLTPDMIKALGNCGFTRVSIGVQTFDPLVQHAIHRIQDAAVTVNAARQLRAAGIAKLNVDLLYGLPHQTTASCIETVKHVLTFAPDRVAVFGYAHVPSLKRHQRYLNEAALPDAAARFDQAEAIANTFAAAGYRRIGLDHFAKPDDDLTRALDAGTLRRNFQGYTTDQATVLLGFGASAISQVSQGYLQNTPRIGAYQNAISAGEFATIRGLALTPEDRTRASVIERLMCDLTVDLGRINASYGGDFEFTRERALIADLAKAGIVRLTGDRITVPEAMRPLVRRVAAVFDTSVDTPATHAPVI